MVGAFEIRRVLFPPSPWPPAWFLISAPIPTVPVNMADPLSIAASIGSILQLTTEVLKYLDDVRNAPKERDQCAIEASNLYSLLTQLRYRLKDSSSGEPWHTAALELNARNGPLDQYKHALQELQRKIQHREGVVGSVAFALTWKFNRREVSDILTRMERLKTHVQIALEMDHRLVFPSSSEYRKNILGKPAYCVLASCLERSWKTPTSSQSPFLGSKATLIRCSNTRAVNSTARLWIGSLRPTTLRNNLITFPKDKKEQVSTSSKLSSSGTGLMGHHRHCSALVFLARGKR